MEADQGKLFVGGISWETNEERLRDYFQSFGDVVEAVIMKDRATGRARGFGFVVFADPAVAERVVKEKHILDGRMVEAKKAVPRDDQQALNRSTTTSFHGSPPPTRTKKIFVGGLASTVTEDDFRGYFEQYGAITDAVVMYDHNTQRPRGFGFITYDSEDAVERTLLKTFHELNDKLVEVKRAIPKELSPGPTLRSPIPGYNNYALNRINSFLNSYTPTNPLGSYGVRMDSRIGPSSGGRNGFPSYGTGYGVGMNLDPRLSLGYGGSPNFNSNLSYLRGLGPHFGSNSTRYNNSAGYIGGNMDTGSVIGPMTRNLWGNGGLNYALNSSNSSNYLSSGNGNLEAFGNTNLIWGNSNSPLAGQGVLGGSGYGSEILGFQSNENNFSLSTAGLARSIGIGAANSSFPVSNTEYDGENTNMYSSNSLYGDPMWRSGSSDLDRHSIFSYGFGSAASNVTSKGNIAFAGTYDVLDRQPNREG